MDRRFHPSDFIVAVTAGLAVFTAVLLALISFRLDRFEEHDRQDRYLLCQIADATSVDADPRPCLHNGKPVRP